MAVTIMNMMTSSVAAFEKGALRNRVQRCVQSGMRRFWHEEDGQSLVEYGLLISLVALVAVVAVTVFGKGVKNNLYGNANSAISNLPTS